MTEYQSTFFAVPKDLIFAANQLAMVVGYSEADSLTFEAPRFQDAAGDEYSARSIWASTALIPALQAPLERPAWDSTGIIDMDAAAEAQAALVFPTEDPLATPSVITALVGMDGLQALAEMGLTAKETA